MSNDNSSKVKDSLWSNLKQNGPEIVVPFLLAGFGMVLAGLLLDHVQHWKVFQKVPELFILVPALLGKSILSTGSGQCLEVSS